MPKENSQKESMSLKKIDCMGSNFSLKFPTLSGKFQTHLGGLITILVGIVSIGAFAVIMSQYFDKSQPIVTTSSEKGPAKLEFNLYREMMFTPIGLYLGPNYITSNWERYVTVKARVRKLFLNESSYKMEITPFLEFDYIPCSQSTDPVVKEFMDLVDIKKIGLEKVYLCPDFRGKGDEFKVVDDFETHEFRVIYLNIYPCSLPNPADCATEKEILAMGVDILPVTKLIETADFENPIRNFMVKRFNEIEPTLNKNLKFDLRNSKVVDDASRFSKPVVKTRFSEAFHRSTDYNKRDGSLYCHPSAIKALKCEEYIRYNYQGVGDVGVIRRNYKKWTEMLGEFGGIMKIISSTVFAVYAFYNLFSMKTYLESVVLGSNQNDHEEASELLKNKQKNSADKKEAKTSKAPKNADDSEPSLKEVLEEMVKTRTTVNSLISKMNTLELLEQIIFDKNEEVKKLIPLVLFQKAQKDLKAKKRKNTKKSKNEAKIPTTLLSNNQVVSLEQAEGEEFEKEKKPASLRETYEILQKSNPEDPLRSIVKEYMQDYLRDLFDENETEMRDKVLKKAQNQFYRKKPKIKQNLKLSFFDQSEEHLDQKKKDLEAKFSKNGADLPESDNDIKNPKNPVAVNFQPSRVVRRSTKLNSPLKHLISRPSKHNRKGLRLEIKDELDGQKKRQRKILKDFEY